MRREKNAPGHRALMTNAQLDTMSNVYTLSRRRVDIVRQDHPVVPHFGVALCFEFDEKNTGYPYFPASATIQFKDFSWGSVEFSSTDSCNFTGVTNEVSDDLSIQVDGYQNDTIFGRFSGVLLSAAGPMAELDNGQFRVLIYRKE
ncbi:MAG: hypothetical protein ACKVU2_07150 [Saprospiraceae bacterium]